MISKERLFRKERAGLRKHKKRKNPDAVYQDEFQAVLRRLRTEKRPSAKPMLPFFRRTERIKSIREKYRGDRSHSLKNVGRKLTELIQTAVKFLRLPELAQFFRWLMTSSLKQAKIYVSHLKSIRIPEIKILKASNKSLQRKSRRLPKVSWLGRLHLRLGVFKLPAVIFSKVKALRIPAVNLSKFRELKLPKLNFRGFAGIKSNVVRAVRFSGSIVSFIDLNRLKSIKLPNLVWFRFSELSFPEVSWVPFKADRLPPFIPSPVRRLLSIIKIPSLVVGQFLSRPIKDSAHSVWRPYLKLFLKPASVGLLLLTLGWYPVFLSTPVPAFAVQIDGQNVAFVSDKNMAETVISTLREERARILERKVEVEGDISFIQVQAQRSQIETAEELKGTLIESLSFVAVATGLKINDQLAFAVLDDATAEKVLSRLKESYIKEGMKIDEISFADQVDFVEIPVSLANVLDEEEALRVLKEGKEKKTVHIVQSGESLWTIAHNYNMSVEDLQAANPSIKGDHVDIGQELNLVAIEPLIKVQIAGEMTVEETIPYKVKVQTDRTLWQGTEKVKVAGENGLREVTYKVVMENGTVVNKEEIAADILKPVTDKVVVRGSRVVVASRGGSGPLGWPISGRITSPFGSRWGAMHTGLDIDGTTGQPVGAAAAGQVVFVGYNGNYGKMISIKHDNGWITRYAHLSAYKVSVGQRVERGDLIGLVGSTGRSTGSHLHFEVIIDGKFQNPTKYLK